jgi:hypothetical protein
VEIPALINREIRNVAYQRPYQSFVADQNNVIIGMNLSLFFEKFRDPRLGFLASFALREAEVC